MIERHAVERRLIGHEIGFEKLIFGSDTSPEKIGQHVRRWDTIFDLLEVDDDCRERLWWLNGAEIYGLETPSWAKRTRKRATPVRIATNGAKPAKAAAKKTKRAPTRSRR
jgi:hypothetical protein